MANVVGKIPVGADTRPLENDISAALSKNYQLKGLNEKAFSQPLGRITGAVDEFRKSLDASNARVLAFGASAGAIFAVQKGFEKLITTTINVQKNLTDINSILGLSAKNLSNFGDQLFKVAGQTGQSFETVSQAAVEFSRQGLGVEETLKRTRDALILTRLSGLDVVSSTQALTATINSFNKVALDSTQIVNKLATVDAAFAVSSADLADAISRVGSSADSVGVNLDQLVALVTSVQQTTARGGAVIGNSLKTIFTRLERTEVLDQLEQLGIQARNLDGSFRPAIDTLTQLSQKFDGLSDSQKGSVAELVGGVFQINILKAALGDLSKEYSIYNNALNTSAGATDAAVKRNEQLNQTLSALINKTSTNFTKLASDVGGLTIAPAIEGLLGNINSALESFNLADAKGPGETLAKGLLEGLGNYISGPGLALIGAVIGKLFINLAKFSGQAVGQILDINKGSQEQAQIQQRINSILAQNPNLIQGILNKQIGLLEVENQILSVIKAQTIAREQSAVVSASLTAGLIGRGVTSVGGKISAKSGGFIPNFSSPEQTEIYGAYLGGYKPGAVSRMNIPGAGSVVYNKAEQVKQFPGMAQPAIMPPEESSAGKKYSEAFQSKLGFNPYAAMGYVPNFAASANQMVSQGYKVISTDVYNTLSKRNSPFNQYIRGSRESGYFLRSDVEDQAIKYYKIETEGSLLARGKGVLNEKDRQQTNAVLVYPSFAGGGLGSTTATALKHSGKKGGESPEFLFSTFGFPGSNGGLGAELYDNVQKALKEQVYNFIKGAAVSPEGIVNEPKFDNYINTNINRSTIETAIGGIFEAGLKSAIFSAVDNPNAPLDLDAGELKKLSTKFKGAKELGGFSLGEVKNALNPSQASSMADKIASVKGYPLKSQTKNKYSGFVPNFSAVAESMRREISAGVSPSSIRVGQDSRLSHSENPLGLGVYNTKDEPAGLGQGIARFKNVFAARKAGASKGFIPNYAERKVPFGQGGGALAASILLPTITGAISSAMPEENTRGRSLTAGAGNIGSYALTGAALGGGAPGAIIGGLIGVATTFLDIQKNIQEEPFKKLEKSIINSQEKLNSLNDSFSKFNSISEKLNEAYAGNIKLSTQELSKLEAQQIATLASLPAETRDAILKALGKGDVLEVQRIQTEALVSKQASVTNDQVQKDMMQYQRNQLGDNLDFIQKFVQGGNFEPKTKERIEKEKKLFEDFGQVTLSNGKTINEQIKAQKKLNPEAIKYRISEELMPQGFDKKAFQTGLSRVNISGIQIATDIQDQSKEQVEVNAKKIKDFAKSFLGNIEKNITETNRIFSEGETNIANVTAQIQSRRGTFLESIKDLFGEFTQLNVSKQFDDAIRNAEYERSRLQITEKLTGSLNNLGANQIDSFRNASGSQQSISDFISGTQEKISNLKAITDPSELAKRARSLSQEYYEKDIKGTGIEDQSRALGGEFEKVAREAEDTANKLKALDSATANSARLSNQEYAAREKLLRVQQAILFAGGIQSYQQNAFQNKTQEFNYARMNLGSTDVSTRGRGALGMLDQLKQLGIGPRDLKQTGLLDTAQAGLEADLKKYLSSIGQNVNPAKISEIAKTQIQNYAKQDDAINAQAVNIPNIDTTVSNIYQQLSDQGIKINNIQELANAINGTTPENPSTTTGQPTTQTGAVISNSPYVAKNNEATKPNLSTRGDYKPTNPESLSPSETLLSNIKAAQEDLNSDDNLPKLAQQSLEHFRNAAIQVGNLEIALQNAARDASILDDKTLNIVQKTQKLTDLHIRDNELAERREKFRTDDITHMNDLVDLANGYLTSVEYANKELERQQNLARRPGYNSVEGITTNFVNSMSYNGTQLFQDLNQSATDVARNIQDSFSNALMGFANSTQSAGDAFNDFAVQILQQVQQISTQIATKLLFGGIFNQFQGLLGGGGGGGLGSLFGFSKGGLVKGYASGGFVEDGSGLTDDVPAMLSKGEYVLNRRAVKSIQQAYGMGFLESLNVGSTRTMAEGGFSKNFDNKYVVTGYENTAGLNTKDIVAGIAAEEAYLNQLKGESVTDSNLSNYALSDPTSRKNEERMQTEQDFYDYVSYIQDNLMQNKMSYVQARSAYEEALNAYNQKQNNLLMSGFLSAAMGIGGGLLGSLGGAGGGGLGSLFGGAKASAYALPGGMGGTSSALGNNYGAVTSLYGGAQKATGFSSLFSSQNLPTLGLLAAGAIGSPFLQNALQSSNRPAYNTVSTSRSNGLEINNRFRFADGGQASDDVPALLMNGEYVVNKESVKKYGAGFFEKLNKGSVNKFAKGGQVGSTQISTVSEDPSNYLIEAINNLTNVMQATNTNDQLNKNPENANSTQITNIDTTKINEENVTALNSILNKLNEMTPTADKTLNTSFNEKNIEYTKINQEQNNALPSLISALTDLNSNLSEKTSSQGMVNNINISVNIEADSKVSQNENSSSSGSEDEDGNDSTRTKNSTQKLKTLTDLIKTNVISTLIEQKRPGGLLNKNSVS